MSRKGKQPIVIPQGVEVKRVGDELLVKGPKGELKQHIPSAVPIEIEKGLVVVHAPAKDKKGMSLHGLYRSLIANMILGISSGFEKRLDLIGVGYRAAVQGNELDLQLGFSHPTKVAIPKGISIKVEKNTIIVSGIDKQLLGIFCADLRALRPPEPYQGKGIRYTDEFVRRKQGKAAGKK